MDYNQLKKKIDSASEYREKSVLPKMRRNLDWINGKYEKENSEIYKYALNVAYSISQVLITSVYAQDPSFTFQIAGDIETKLSEVLNMPVKLRIDQLESALERVTKIYFKEMKSRATNKRVVQDAVWAGFGCTKMGYSFDIDKSVSELREKSPEEYCKLAETLNYSDVIKKDEPFKVRVSPLDIILPCDAPSLYELPWVCQIVYMNQDDAKELYGLTLPLTASSGSVLQTEKEKDKVKIYEFHSLDPRDPYIYTIAEGYNKIVMKKEHPLYDGTTIKNMFQFLWFNEPIDDVYPIADLTLVEDQIREINIAVSKRIELIKRNSAIYIANGQFETNELNKIKEAKDGAVVEIYDPSASITQMPILTLGQEFYNNISSMRSEILEVLGLTDYAAGGTTQQRKATEAQLMEKSRVDRVKNRINAIDEFVFLQADTFVEIMKHYKITDRVFRIAFDKDDVINFEFNGILLNTTDAQIQVIPGSTVLMDTDMELRRVTQLVQIAAAFPGVVNLPELWKEVLRKSGFSNDVERFVMQQQPMLPEQGMQPESEISGLEPIEGIPSPTPMQMGTNPALEQGL